MGVEIERKFLVDHEAWHKLDKPAGTHYQQGYILSDESRTVRVRVTDTNSYITLKGRGTTNISRPEFEYEIPVTDGKELLKTFTKNGTEKTRYRVPFAGFTWEVDEFLGDNEGLIVAEIELNDEHEQFEKPAWITNEVTDDGRYANSSLAVHPFKDWEDK
jgi:CYTH domain-containing protein